MNISIQVDSKFENGQEEIKVIVNNYINNLTMGEVVRFSYIYPLIYQIPGVVVADVKLDYLLKLPKPKTLI